MKCPNCQTTNPDGAKFCLNCGNALSLACPSCGTPYAPGAKFCHNCGHALAPPPAPGGTIAPGAKRSGGGEGDEARLQKFIPKELAAKLESARANRSMEGERRIVTILFCDVKGSTALAEQLDPEEWAEIMNDAFKYLIEPVYRYEGTLARLMGDAILAFFGAPIAHEDDPQRAALAGLGIVEGIGDFRERMKRERGLDFNVRVGINTGLVVVGEVGSDMRVEYTAMGDAVNVASRMEQTAQPGTVQIAANTYKLIAPLFEFEPLGDVEVKGKSEPVMAYRVIAPKAQPGRLRGIAGLDSPLVGREEEMDALRRAVGGLLEGRGQIVSVMGEAGLGKSRLVAELRGALIANGISPLGAGLSSGLQSASGEPGDSDVRYAIRDTPSAIFWHEGRSLSYETSTPYAPFISLFADILGIGADETDAAKHAKVKARATELLPGRVADIAPLIATMLGIQFGGEDLERVKYLEPPQLREKSFHAVRDFFERLAGTGPLVLVFEDLHWADSTSLDLLEYLLPLTDRAMLAIVALFRPQRQEPSWRFHETAARDYAHRYTSLALEPLDEQQSRELVANLLHVEDLPEKVRALILKKSEGNPFFVEEVIRSLLDAKLVVRENSHWRATREIVNITLPDTLAGVITARLDRLDDGSKRTAQTAAVIGREFQFDTLAQVYDARPELDGALGDLQRRELIREKMRVPQPVYQFKHVLTQETAYASLLLSKRRELHRRVAECLERTDKERVNDIARHFLEAHDTAKALPYLVEAGDRAARAYSMPEAIGFFSRALEIARTGDDTPLARRSFEGLGRALTLANDIPRAVENYRAMNEYARAHGDTPMQVSALNKMSDIMMFLGQFDEIEKNLVEAERLAHEYEDQAGLAELYTVRCSVCNSTGNFGGAVKYLEASVQVGRALNIKEQMAFGLTHIANTLTFITKYDEAWQNAQEAYRVSEEIGDLQHKAELLCWPIPNYHLRNGDLDLARRQAEDGVTLARRIGVSIPEYTGASILGTIAQLRGEYQDALAHFERALSAARATGFPPFEVMALGGLGSVFVDIRDRLTDRATEIYARALQMMEHPLAAAGGGTAWADIGFSALAAGDIDTAGQHFQQGLTTPTLLGLMQKPRFFVGSGLVALARGQSEEAAKLVMEARAYAEERGMKHFYPMIALADGQVSAARSATERALESFARAESLALVMQMRPTVWQARAGAAKALAALGRAAEAQVKQAEARAVIDEIAVPFEDDNLRAMFVESATRKLAHAE